MLGLFDMTAIKTIWGHSSVGRAPAWHEATKSINMTRNNWSFEFNITKYGAEQGVLLVKQILIINLFYKTSLSIFIMIDCLKKEQLRIPFLFINLNDSNEFSIVK